MIYIYECTKIFKEAERTDAQFPAFGKKGKPKSRFRLRYNLKTLWYMKRILTATEARKIHSEFTLYN